MFEPGLVAQLIFAVVFVISYLLLTRRRKHIKGNSGGDDCDNLPLPPVLSPLSILWSLPSLVTRGNLHEFVFQKSRQLGKVFSVKLGSKLIVFITGSEAIHEALVTRGTEFADRFTAHMDQISNPCSYGLGFRPYDDSYKLVKHLSLSILKEFGFGKRIMETRILTEVEAMIRYVRDLDGTPVDPFHVGGTSGANVTLNVLFGRRFDYNDQTLINIIADAKKGFTSFAIEIDLFPVLRRLPFYQRKINDYVTCTERVRAFCDENITICLQDKTNADNFVRCFADKQGPAAFNRTELTFIARDLITGTVDSSTTFLRWTCLLLANHPLVQDRVCAEIDSVVDGDRLPGLDDRSRMPYVQATIMEILRYRTVFPMAAFRELKTDTQVNGYFIPAGTMVVVSVYSVDVDPDTWQRPDLFRPERFLDASGNVVDRDKVIPFSIGKRSCFAEQLARPQMFLFFSSLLQQFYIRPPAGQDHIDDTAKFAFSLFPLRPFKVRFIPRRRL